MSEKSRILIVEDSQVNAQLLTAILSQEGYITEVVYNGLRAIEIINKEMYDLILLDIMMPEIGGFEVCEHIKKQKKTKNIPIIFLTAKTDNESVARGFELGAVDYVKKPFERFELLARVRTHLELQKSRRKVQHELEKRKETERKLNQTLNYLELVLENIPSGVFSINKDMEIVSWNKRAAEITGYSAQEVKGKRCDFFVHQPCKEPCILTEENKQLKTLETQITTKSGKIRLIAKNAIVLENEEGEIIGGIESFQDITEKKETEKQLINSQKRLQALFSHSLDAIFIIDNKLNIIETNPAARYLLKYDKDILHTKSIKDIVPLHLDLKQKFNQLQEDGYISIETLLLQSNNSEIDVHLRAVANFLPGLHLAFVNDISNRKKAERELVESEKRFRKLFNKNNDAVYIYHYINGKAGKFIEINERTIEMLGYSRDELLKMNLTDIVLLSEKKHLEKRLTITKKQMQNMYESKIVSKNGKVIPVEVNAQYFLYKDQPSIISVVRDISERKELQKKLVSTIIKTEEKERDRFAKDLHDSLGALLSSINIYLDMMNSGEIDEDEQKETLTYTQELLSEAINSTKEIANNIRPTILSNFGFIASIQSFCDKLNKTGKIKIEFNHNDFNLKLDSDSEIILFRIANELINNTLKYAEANNVYIEISNQANVLNLKYSDDGKGFDVDEILESEKGGMGLKNIISRINSIQGEVTIDSEKKKGVEVNIKVKI